MDFADRDGVIWMDGELVPWRDANVHVLTHTLHYGLGVFEGVRAYEVPSGTALFRLQDHTNRLFRSAHIMGLDIPFDRDTLNDAQVNLVRENELKTAYVRPLVYLGAEGMGLRADNLSVHVAIAAWEWGTYLGAENMERGISVRTSSYTRHHVNISMCKAKTVGNYSNSILALQEALATGHDEALLLDNEGYVQEGSGENLFLVRDGALYTPDPTSALDGITRSTVFSFAAELGIPVHEKRITRDEVYIAEEAFFTGTAAEVTPIREADGRIIGNGARGPLTEKLQQLYFDQVTGRRNQNSEWLTSVY